MEIFSRNDTVLTCPHCQRQYRTLKGYKNHLMDSHDKVKMLKCKKCNFKTKWRNSMKTHKLRHEKHVVCDLCDTLFLKGSYMKAHRIKVHVATIDPNNPEAPPSYECDKCDLRFASKLYLARHRPEHNGKTRLDCDKCRKFFWNEDELKCHYEQAHPIQEPLECDHCKRLCRNRKIMQLHMRTHYKEFVCHICGSQFSTKTLLTEHVRRHNKDWKVFCNICHKGYVNISELKEHEHVHYQDKIFMCDICGTDFTNKKNLKKHQKLHKDPEERKRYFCDNCDFVTFHSKSLKFHLDKHRGEHREQCKICERSISKNYIGVHVKSHFNEYQEFDPLYISET